MVGWSIRRAAIAAALVSVAVVPAVAQDWSPPPQSDDGYQQAPDDGYQQAPDDGDGYQQGDNQDYGQGYGQPPMADPDQNDGDDQGYQDDTPGSSSDNGDRYAPPPTAAPYGDDGDAQGYAPDDTDNGDGQAYAPNDAAPQSYGNDDNSWREWHDPDGQTAALPQTSPGYQRSAGIATRDQAMSGCLTAVRARVGGTASASRVDGIRGEWMVSGALGTGKTFYCSVRHGAVDTVELAG
ncbi:hypothetical protein EAH79_15450 [Sphingomonas koreensis]|nr:hypothetical protein EAH79_15450 [Sphingomonas koreensis]